MIEDFKPNAIGPDTPLADLSVNYIVYSSLTEPQNAAEIKSQLGEQREGTKPLIVISDSRYLILYYQCHKRPGTSWWVNQWQY